jgi:tRNA/rRNA methyltransferase
VETNVSMNLGQAVAVCLYQLSAYRTPDVLSKPRSSELAASGQLERISHLLLELLLETDYTQPHTQSAVEEKVRRLIRRMQLNHEDAELWMGMLRQIQWRIRKP